MSERSQAPRPEGEYFETNRFAGLSVLLGGIAFVALVLCVIGAAVEPIQFSFSALCFRFLLHALCRLFLMDDHSSRR